MTSPTPSAQTPMVDAKQRPTQPWFSFFASLGSGASPAPVQTITAPSPLNFAAPGAGTLIITGGTITALSVTRGRVTLALPTSTAILPLGRNDLVTVTFTAAPALSFLPS